MTCFSLGLHAFHGMSVATFQPRLLSAESKTSRNSCHRSRWRSGGRENAGASIAPDRVAEGMMESADAAGTDACCTNLDTDCGFDWEGSPGRDSDSGFQTATINLLPGHCGLAVRDSWPGTRVGSSARRGCACIILRTSARKRASPGTSPSTSTTKVASAFGASDSIGGKATAVRSFSLLILPAELGPVARNTFNRLGASAETWT